MTKTLPTLAARLALVCATSAACTSPLLAAAQAPTEQARFDIPAMALDKALDVYSRQAGIQLLFPYNAVAKKKSAALRGTYSRKAALDNLIVNSGLRIVHDNGRTISLALVDTASTQPTPSAAPPENHDIIVTGRAGTKQQDRSQLSYSVTRIDEAALRLQAPSSVTEALKSVPGYWVEASGGEASGNVRARGVPVDGFGSINLLEDGVPIQHDPALGYLNADQVFRIDETIDRIEVVRGGPSAVFYSNAPAGAVNFIPRKVGDHAEGLAKATLGTDGLYRFDLWAGAPVGDWKVQVGGFYRAETGVRDPGYTGNSGGQIRLGIARDFERGHFSLDLKRMDDKVIFYAGIPMYHSANGILPVPGFNGNSGTLAGPETMLLDMKMADGSVYHYDNTEGTHVKRTQITSHFDYDIADDFKFKTTLRYSDTATQRNGFFPNSVLTAANFLTANASQLASAPTATALQLRYVNGGAVFDTANQNGNGDVVQAGLRALTLPVKEFIADNQLSHRFTMGDMTHDITVGYYYAHISEQFSRYSTVYLTDVQNNARLLNLVAVDASGNVVKTMTDNGAIRYGYEWENAAGEQTTNALYAADEFQITPKLRVDGGLRWENMSTSGSVGLKQTVNQGTYATSAMVIGNGQYAHYNVSFSKLAWTLGANYQFADRFGAFARYTFSNRLPSLGNFVTSAAATPIIQTMNLGEAGLKFAAPKVQVYATAFWTKYNNVSFTNTVFDPVTSAASQQTLYANTRTLGLELEGKWQPLRWFDISATATLEDPRYKNFIYTDATKTTYNFDGHQLIRVPKVSFRVVPGVNLLDDRLRLQAAVEYEGKRFVDTANTVVLPAYTAVNLSAQFAATKQLTLYGYVDNVTNSLGLTEGNPRAGEVASTDAGANAFVARPLLGRNFRVSALFKY